MFRGRSPKGALQSPAPWKTALPSNYRIYGRGEGGRQGFKEVKKP